MFNLIGDTGDQWLTVFDQGYTKLQSMHSSHPRFASVLERVEAGEYVEESEFDPAEAAREAFEAVGQRVSVKGGLVYLDGDPVDNSCTKAILRFLEDGEEFTPLVRFFENVQANPSQNSREQLYSFLAANDYTLTQDGLIVGYKAVQARSDGSFESIRAGQPGDVQVNGVDAPERPIQAPGDVVTMARSKVNPDEFVHCSVGLHVAAWPYAAAGGMGGIYSGGELARPVLRVLVNPTDVVSVPTDHSAQKMRVCRYTVDAVIDSPDERALFTTLGEVEPQFGEDERPIELCTSGLRKFRRTGERRAPDRGEWYVMDGGSFPVPALSSAADYEGLADRFEIVEIVE